MPLTGLRKLLRIPTAQEREAARWRVLKRVFDDNEKRMIELGKREMSQIPKRARVNTVTLGRASLCEVIDRLYDELDERAEEYSRLHERHNNQAETIRSYHETQREFEQVQQELNMIKRNYEGLIAQLRALPELFDGNSETTYKAALARLIAEWKELKARPEKEMPMTVTEFKHSKEAEVLRVKTVKHAMERLQDELTRAEPSVLLIESFVKTINLFN